MDCLFFFVFFVLFLVYAVFSTPPNQVCLHPTAFPEWIPLGDRIGGLHDVISIFKLDGAE